MKNAEKYREEYLDIINRLEEKLEGLECEKFATWLNDKNYRFTHIANETARNKKISIAKGFPDYIIFLKRGGTLFLEMKLPRRVFKS